MKQFFAVTDRSNQTLHSVGAVDDREPMQFVALDVVGASVTLTSALVGAVGDREPMQFVALDLV